jgi:hypothetical protein
MVKKASLSHDIDDALHLFPRLKKYESSDSYFVKGVVELKDKYGGIIDEFKVRIDFPSKYPFCYPTVKELANRIPKDEDWHCNSDGSLCITSRPFELLNCRLGISLKWFIEIKLLPHLALQLLKLEEDSKSDAKYLNGEYSHGVDGEIEALLEICQLNNREELLQLLGNYFKHSTHERNKLCFCGSGEKFKRCHQVKFKDLDFFGKKYLASIKESLEKSNLSKLEQP